MPTYRQTVGVQSGHAASGGGSGVQHVLLCHFELSALRRHIALPHGHQNWILVTALQPLFRLHGGLRPRCVRVQVVLEEVRLRKRVGEVKKDRCGFVLECTVDAFSGLIKIQRKISKT